VLKTSSWRRRFPIGPGCRQTQILNSVGRSRQIPRQ
jgi:hypothetical protein